MINFSSLKYHGRVHQHEDFTDYEFTDGDSNKLITLTHCADEPPKQRWYAVVRYSKDKDSAFDWKEEMVDDTDVGALVSHLPLQDVPVATYSPPDTEDERVTVVTFLYDGLVTTEVKLFREWSEGYDYYDDLAKRELEEAIGTDPRTMSRRALRDEMNRLDMWWDSSADFCHSLVMPEHGVEVRIERMPLH